MKSYSFGACALTHLNAMQGRNIIRLILFFFFFGIGAATMGLSILCNDLVQYYTNRQLLEVTQQSLDRLESLNTDYDVLLKQLQEDPNLVKRLAPATLGAQPEDANAVYPRATKEQVDAVRDVLRQDTNDQSASPVLPQWLIRCSEPNRRTTLFIAGAVLILISLTCFNPAKRPAEQPQQ